MKITDIEYNKIIEELTERIKDLVSLNMEMRIRQECSKKRVETFLGDNPNSKVEVFYSFIFNVNDLRQILSRSRRNKSNKNVKTTK
jgi:hypothetical protein